MPVLERLQKNSDAMNVLRYILLTFVVFIIILIFGSMIFKPFIPDTFTLKEAPLKKNTELQIKPSELYVYTYTINNTNNTLSFRTGRAPNCVFIYVVEALNRTGTCINQFGNDKVGSNATLEVSYLSLFKPWMLAVDENWTWDVTMTVNATGQEIILKTFTYETLRVENMLGRDAFVVRIAAREVEQEIITTWVDVEKRVMLKEVGPNYVVILTKAPFLNASN